MKIISIILLWCMLAAHSLNANDFFSLPENFNAIYLNHTEGKGLGYTKGYTTLGSFFNPFLIKSFSPFIDVRTHYFNDGKLAANIGLGTRHLLPAYKKVFGWNVFYDCSDERKYSQQIGVGCEWLGCSYDIRINGYLPIGKSKLDSHIPTIYLYPGGYIAKTKLRTASLFGFDYEIGTKLDDIFRGSSFNIYAAIGGYYYNREFDLNINGGRIRIVAILSDYLSLKFKASYDNYFYESIQTTLCLSIPLGGPKKCSCERLPSHSKSIFMQPVQRNEIITNSLKYHVWNVNWE